MSKLRREGRAAWRKGHQLPATLGVMGGFIVMMVLDNAFA